MPKFKPNVLKRTQKLDLISEKNGFRQAVYEWNGIYKGQWEKNMKSGRGIMFYNKNNIIYNGEWKEDMRHGFGKLIRQHYDHGELICEGHWIKNKFVKGICYGRNGVYDGEYLPGTRIKHGFGTMRWNNNSAYTGFWINNKYHGKGTFVEENGCYWDGQWKCGLKNGEGTFVNKLIGQKVNGVWLNGSLVSISSDSELSFQRRGLQRVRNANIKRRNLYIL
ncbi:radial spoke head 10 homolog B-like [Daktulosphaira vitifoliae]|uniref:radial spoke head 10 homolog B-like n=1 Tax=Daktulosphaira vitifoliae TaxID=58002 RepID=UPI0021AAD38E|nr:radial spoke head 10 homolog B-like [Daktulosphaira vitifoliae]